MSRLLGIVNSKADPADHFAYWLWRSDVPWDAEQITVEQSAVDGNTQFRIMGPATPKNPDGIFLRMHINPQLNPEPLYTADRDAAAPAHSAPVVQMTAEAPPITAVEPSITVASTDPLPGESKAQHIRRKAIALRWQASKLEKLAQDMEEMEAQGLI